MATTGNLLGTAVSGLLAYQRALAITGHNTTNVNTPGYSRQSIDLATRIPLSSGAGFIGNGVDMQTVSRAYDSFVTTQLRATTSGSSQLDAFYAFAKQIDNVVADSQSGLAPALQQFFDATSDVASNPSSTAARQVMISQANALVNRFQFMDDRMGDLQTNANSQIRGAIAEINSFAQSVAQLNQQIYELQGGAGDSMPNDLLDQRDEALRQLAERVGISVVNQDNGMVSVFAGNGQSLVLGNQYGTLSALQNEFDPTNVDIGMSFAGGIVDNITSKLNGGTLGGALEFRDNLLATARNQLGRIAIGLSDSFNAQHQLGLDMNNSLGGDFFTDLGTQQSLASSNNNAATNVVFTGTVTDIGALQASDYRIDFNAGLYTVTRVSDGTVVGSNAVPTFNLTATEGFSLSSVVTVAPSNGDSFLLQLTANGAGAMGVEVTQVSQIAAASSLRTGKNPANTGGGAISQGSVTSTTGLPLGGAITLTYDPNALGAGIPGFTVAGGPGGTLAYDPATEASGKTFTFPGFGGVSFTVSGIPATGDQFTIANNNNGFADNRNMLALAALQTTPTMVNGTTGPTMSVFGVYSELVSNIGSRTRQAEIDSQAQGQMLLQAQEAWSNKSGVNLDEEAANLIKYQQIYQASAQLVNAASTIFNTLLSAMNR